MSGRLLSETAKAEAWEDDEVIITLGGAPTGGTLSKREGKTTAYWLNERGGLKAVRVAQCAHTERRWATGMADWLDEDCFDHGHLNYEDGSSTAKRRNCPQCWGRLVRALREGKAPTPSGQWPEGDSEEGTLIKRQKCPNCNVPLKPDNVCPICSSFFSFD